MEILNITYAEFQRVGFCYDTCNLKSVYSIYSTLGYISSQTNSWGTRGTRKMYLLAIL